MYLVVGRDILAVFNPALTTYVLENFVPTSQTRLCFSNTRVHYKHLEVDGVEDKLLLMSD